MNRGQIEYNEPLHLRNPVIQKSNISYNVQVRLISRKTL